jgi:hypothetical protein
METLLDPINLAPNLLVTGFALWVLWFAWTRGGSVERFMAVFNTAEWLGWWAIALAGAVLRGDPRPPWMVPWLFDFAEAAAFLWLAIRHDNRWMALGAAAQGVQMGVRASGLIVGEMNSAFAYFVGTTVYVMSVVMGVAIAGSAMTHRRRTAAAASA